MNSQAKVGLLVIVAAIIMTYSTFQIQNIRMGNSKGYILRGYFDSVAGLEIKSSIKVAGVEVGKVRDIRLKPDGRAEVLMQINPDVIIHYGAEASTRSTGLLGEKYVDITPGVLTDAPLKDGDTVPALATTADIDEIARKLSAIANDVKAVTETFKKVLGGAKGEESIQNIIDNIEVATEGADKITKAVTDIVQSNEKQIKQIIDNVSRFTKNLDELVMENRGLVNDSMKNILQMSAQLNDMVKDNTESLDKIIANLEDITTTFKEDSPDITSGVKTVLANANDILKENRAALNKTLTKMGEASERLNTALGNIDQVTTQVKSGKGTIGKLVYNESAYNNLDKGLKKVNNLLQKLEELKTFIGVRTEYDTRAGNSKTYVSLKIQPREDKFYLLEVVDDPRGNQRTKTTVTETEDLSSGNIIRDEEERETSTGNEIEFSLQLAKRFYDFVVRGGIIESSGGVGIDYYLFDDDLRLSFEAWDFVETDAHLKVTGRYFVQNNIFLQLGGDDLANEDFRNFFVGAGFFFSDDDLKYLISGVTVPLPQ